MFTEIYNSIALYVLRSPRCFVCCHFVCLAKVSDAANKNCVLYVISHSLLLPSLAFSVYWNMNKLRNSSNVEFDDMGNVSAFVPAQRLKRVFTLKTWTRNRFVFGKKKKDQNASIRSWPLLAKGRAAVYFDFLFISSCAFRYGDIGLLACSV